MLPEPHDDGPDLEAPTAVSVAVDEVSAGSGRAAAGPPTAAGPHAPNASAAPSELEVLDGLERDLAAVEEAMAGLDGLDAGSISGSEASARVASIVDSARFAVAAPEPDHA